MVVGHQPVDGGALFPFLRLFSVFRVTQELYNLYNIIKTIA